MVLLPHGPEPCASANSAIPACKNYITIFLKECQRFFGNQLLSIVVKCLWFILRSELIYDTIQNDFGFLNK